MSSWRMNPLGGNLAPASKSSTVQIEAAVVIWMALKIRPSTSRL